MQSYDKTIRSVLLPLSVDSVLLPHSAMMEVLPERNIEPIEGSSDWVLGEISWNNQQIPLIAIEAAFADKAAEKPKRSRVVIVASISDKNKYSRFSTRNRKTGSC